METKPSKIEQEPQFSPEARGQEWIDSHKRQLNQTLASQLAKLWEGEDVNFLRLAVTQVTGQRVGE